MRKTTAKAAFFTCILMTLLSFLTPPLSAFQTMQKPTRGKTAGPAATKASPERAKTFHKATPKSLLVVKKIYITPGHPRLGDTVAIHALVANNGSKTVQKVKIAFYLGKKQVAWAMDDIKSRSARDFRGLFTRTQAPKPGTYTVSALIDPDRTLERTFYKGNSASLKITILPPAVKTTRQTVGNRNLTPKSKSRVAAGPGRTVSRQKRTPSANPEVKTGMKTRVPTRRIAPMPSGQIHTVTVKILTHSRTSSSQTRRGKNIHALEIRWARKGALPNHVDIFLHPYRRSGKELCLKRNAVNNGHATLPVPGKINSKQMYIVRVQTHDGKIHGDSKTFSLSSGASVKTAEHPQAVTAARHAKGGSVAATPISIPRTADLPTHKKTSHAKQVKLDPGIGPNRPVGETTLVRNNSSSSSTSLYSNHPNPDIIILTPSHGATWSIGKSHKIQWSSNIPQVKIEKITLLEASSRQVPVLTIFPNSSNNIENLKPLTSGFANWTIPATIKAGSYYILIKAGILTVKSAKFHIMPYMQVKLEKGDEPRSPIPSSLQNTNDKNAPRITYHYAPSTIYDKDTFNGSHFYIPIPRLPLSIYWEDPDGDLAGGKYRFTYSYTCNTASPPRIDDGWQSFHAIDNYRGEKGMGVFSFEIHHLCTPHTFHYTFTLMDSAGHVSNTVRGTFHWDHDGNSTSPNPKSGNTSNSSPQEETDLSIYAPKEWVSNLPVFIQGKIPPNMLKKKNRYEITLWDINSGKTCGKIMKEIIDVHYTKSKEFNVTWTVNPKLAPTSYCLKVKVNDIHTKTKIIKIVRSGLKLEPIKGPLQVGNRITIKWSTTVKNSENYTYNLYWHSLADGKEYLIGNGKIGAQSFAWQTGACLPTGASTAKSLLPPNALGKGYIRFKGRLYGCSSTTNPFDISEPSLEFKDLGIKITEPNRNSQWGGQTYWVRWKTTKNTPFCLIEVSVINAITGRAVSGPWTCWTSDGDIHVHIPEYDNNHKILTIPARIKIKPLGRISEDHTVYSEPFEIL